MHHPGCDSEVVYGGVLQVGSEHAIGLLVEQHRRADAARTDGVNANVLVAQLKGQGAHQADHAVLGGNVVADVLRPLICVGDPRKGGSVGCFIVTRSHFRSVLRAVDRKSGSRWSARSAARTNDLEADEDAPHTGSVRSEAKMLRFKSCGASASCSGPKRASVACRRPALSGSTDDGPAT